MNSKTLNCFHYVPLKQFDICHLNWNILTVRWVATLCGTYCTSMVRIWWILMILTLPRLFLWHRQEVKVCTRPVKHLIIYWMDKHKIMLTRLLSRQSIVMSLVIPWSWHILRCRRGVHSCGSRMKCMDMDWMSVTLMHIVLRAESYFGDGLTYPLELSWYT